MKIPKIISNSALYGLSSFVQMGLGFFLLPIYTYYLTPEDYGILNVITAITAFLSRLILLSLHTAATRFHFKSERNEYRAKIWGTLFLMVLLNSVFWGVIAMAFHNYLIDPLAKGIHFYPLFFLSILGTLLSPLYLFYQEWLRSCQNGTLYTINAILYFIINALGNLLCLIVMQLGVLGMVISNCIVSLLFLFYSLFKFAPLVTFRYNKKIGIAALKYALPLVPHNFINYWSGSVDKIFLNNLAGASSVGLFAIGSQFGSVVNVVADALNKAFSPWCFQIMTHAESEDFKKLYIFTDVGVLICCLFAMALSLFSPEVILLMTSTAFSKSWMPVTFVCFGFVAKGIYMFTVQPLFFSQTKYVMIISISSLTLNVFFNILLIPRLGFVGAGASFLSSMMLMAILTMTISRYLVPQIRFHFKKMLMFCIIFFVLSLPVYGLQCYVDHILYRLFLKIVWMSVIFLVCFYYNREHLKLFVKDIRRN